MPHKSIHVICQGDQSTSHLPGVQSAIDEKGVQGLKISEKVDYHWESWLRPDK
jgi:hypothetical protein